MTIKPIYAVLIALAVFVSYQIGRYIYKTPTYITGEQSADFSGTLPDGSAFKLSQLKGQYVLLDFWGSWCGPCIAEAPELRKLYSTFHGKTFQDAAGFEIVSVGVERDPERWKGAIEALSFNWPYHISDMKMFDNAVAAQYGVRVIPTKLLLNPDGLIIGTNQTFGEIERMLSSKL